MGFIADSIRIAKDGKVTTAQEAAVATTKNWTAKAVCFEIVDIGMGANADNAKRRVRNMLQENGCSSVHIGTIDNWIDKEWDRQSGEKKIYVLCDYVSRRVP
jgi:hypothetical protein